MAGLRDRFKRIYWSPRFRPIRRKLEGHITVYLFGKRITVFGLNAMHVAVNISPTRWGYVCFHPPVWFFGHHWPWYFYVSPNATPWASTYAIGPGVDRTEKAEAKLRRLEFGHNFRVSEFGHEDIHPIQYGRYKISDIEAMGL